MAWGIGANDVANAMGTSVGSRSITIKQAIIIAAIFEVAGVLLAGSEVTNTIRQKIVHPSLFIDSPELLIYGMLAALFSAATWLFIASYFGWPVSTTHTIVGAIVGFGVYSLGIDAVQWKMVGYIISSWLLSPCLGAIIAYILFFSMQKLIFNTKDPLTHAKKIVPFYIFIVAWIIAMIALRKGSKFFSPLLLSIPQCMLYATIVGTIFMLLGYYLIGNMAFDPKANRKFHYTNVEKIFAVLMIFTACAMAFAHGSNDVANAIGPVAAIVAIVTKPEVASPTAFPLWVLMLGAVGIIMGLATFGHKVMATIGTGITQLTPSRGFAVTLAAAMTVVLASSTGIPISTTHTLVGGILGVGLARGIDALNLKVIRSIFLSWIITLPVGAALAVGYYVILLQLFCGLQ